MHSVCDKTKGITIFHHSDLSGDLEIVKWNPENPNEPNQTTIEVPGELVKLLVANYLRSNLIAAIEDMSAEELLGDKLRFLFRK